MAKVSIVIPVYNVEKYIRECLDSVVNQTLNDIEIICVDDGSTDSCPAILDEYAANDNRIKVIHKPNGGYGKAVNTGMDCSSGEYFAIVESDDIVNLTMYETLYELAKNYEADVVKADFYRFVIENGVMKKEYANIAKPQLYGQLLNHDESVHSIIQDASLYTWSGIYRKQFLYDNAIRHNETPGASYQDNGFWFQTMCTAATVYFLDKPFYMLRRDNPNSSINNKGKVYCIRDEYEFVLQYLKNRPQLYKEVIGDYWWARFGAYRYSYRRIATEFKEEFIHHFHDVFIEADSEGELDRSLFSKTSLKDLEGILSNPDRYNIDYLKQVDRSSQKRSLYNRLKWCYEDNGLLYTIKHIFGRLISKFKNNTKNNKKKPNSIKVLINNNIDRTKRLEKIIKKQDEKIDRILEILENQAQSEESNSEKWPVISENIEDDRKTK